MRELLILRHAKAESKDGKPDFERELTTDGWDDARRMGRFLVRRGWIPDWVVTSPAPRARQTCDAACEEVGAAAPAIREEHAIYEAAAVTLLSVLRHVPVAARLVLIVGHNPGFEELAIHLAGGDEPLRGGLPKAGLVRLKLPDDWSDLPYGCGHDVVLFRPKEL